MDDPLIIQTAKSNMKPRFKLAVAILYNSATDECKLSWDFLPQVVASEQIYEFIEFVADDLDVDLNDLNIVWD